MEILTDYMPWIIAAIVLILIFIFLATHRKNRTAQRSVNYLWSHDFGQAQF